MGSYHNFVSLSQTHLKAHLNDLSYRRDEIKYVWQAEGHWTIATALFGFVRDQNTLKRRAITTFWLRIDI